MNLTSNHLTSADPNFRREIIPPGEAERGHDNWPRPFPIAPQEARNPRGRPWGMFDMERYGKGINDRKIFVSHDFHWKIVADMQKMVPEDGNFQ